MQSIKEIERLIKAIQARDSDAAREAAVDHVKSSARSALDAVEHRQDVANAD